MKIKLVTSFNQRIFNEYASKSIKTWVDNIDLGEGEIEVWINGPFPEGLPKQTSDGTPFKYKMLDTQSEGWQYFYETFAGFSRPDTPPGQEYRFNFLPFSCKVYALAEAAHSIKEQENDFDYLVWLDADVIVKNKFTKEDVIKILNGHSLAWLDRARPWAHGETGFIACSTKDDTLDLFLTTANTYGSGMLFYLAEWHDAFVYTSQIRYKEFTDLNFKVLNLNQDFKNEHEKGLYPFKTSILNEWFEHYKGQIKGSIK